MRPPAASRLPRLTTSPAVLFTLTLTFGVAESTSSTLEPAASTTRPPGALISPSFRTVAPISAISPPRLLRSSPWLTIAGRRTRTLGEADVAGQPVGVVEVQGRGHQPGDVDPRALAEQHAVRVEQPDPAVAAQVAEDGRRIVAGDAVEDLAGGVGLLEAHRIAGPDREGVPVDDGVRRVVHRQRAADGAARDGPAIGVMPLGSAWARTSAAPGQQSAASRR